MSSAMVPLGSEASPFDLPDPSGVTHSLDEIAADAPGTLVMFLCNHCPYVKHVADQLAALTREWMSQGLAVVAISSNDVEAHPDDAPDKMAEESATRGYAFPYLFDESQDVAKAYHAACTPDFFLYDADRKLAYRGQMDDSRPNSGTPVTGAELATAVEAVLAGRPVPEPHNPSMGCNIKWKPGNEPDYFA